MEELKPSPANSTPLTPLSFLERAATAYGDSPSIIYNDTVYTWSQTYRRCLQLASSLSSIGIKPGHVVSVVAPNMPAMYELQFAVPMSGAVLNNVNTHLDARSISVLLQHCESTLVFVDCLSASLLRHALSLFPPHKTPPRFVLIAEIDENMPDPSSTTSADFFATYEDLLQKGDPNFKWVQPRSEWDPMVLNYTSGTTSSPKGVVHCHRGLFLMSLETLLDWGVPKQQPTFLWTLSMFHANGWTYVWAITAVGGANICLRSFDASKIFQLIKRHGVTHMCAAPIILNMLTNSPGNQPLESLVEILTSGAPPPAAVLSKVEKLGFVVSHGYGLTETEGLVVSCAWKRQWDSLPPDERAKYKSRQGVGIAGFGNVDVVDPDSGESVKRDGLATGEVVLKGGNVMLGYFKDPVGTMKCMKQDGWFYTGDIGVMHPDGYLEIKDRSKDVIICGGENVSSVEVDSVIYTNPAVKDVAVVARPDEFWGELPCAFVSLKEGEFVCTEKDLIAFCKEKLPHYMVPKTVVFEEELPKTATGKIQKFALRELAKDMGASRKWYKPTKAQPKALLHRYIPIRRTAAFAYSPNTVVAIPPSYSATFLRVRPSLVRRRYFSFGC